MINPAKPPIDKRKWAVIAVVLLVAAAIAFGLSLTRTKDAPGAESASEQIARRAERLKDACASKATYDRLKQVAFEEAVRIRNADPANLDTLATHSVVRMENPIVKSRDEELNVTVCTGRFVLELPPGAEQAFGGERRLTADIEYAAQAAADGSGLVYQLDGAEPIIYKLAAFDLKGGRYQPPPPVAAVEYAEREVRTMPIPEPEPDLAPPAPVERPMPRPMPPVFREPEPEQEAPIASRVRARPSFNCRYARSRSEKLVCGSNALAARDRAMSSLFYSAIADADPGTKRRIRGSRDAFLSRRERCASEACVAAAYEDRIDEIRSIASGEE